VFIVAGVEGTGHHFWNEVNQRLLEAGGPPSAEHEHVRMAMVICLNVLSSKLPANRLPCTRRPGGCSRASDLDVRSCPAFANASQLAPRRDEALYVPGCSFPCGSPQAKIPHHSPDLVRLDAEARANGVRLLSVAMVRDPIAFAWSSFSRRHPESSFRATAFNLYLNLGLLDHQLAVIGNYHLTYYEKLVDVTDRPTLLALAAFLNIPPRKLIAAVDNARPAHKLTQPPLSRFDRLYVEDLYYGSSAATFIPIFWRAFRVYKPPTFWDLHLPNTSDRTASEPPPPP